MRIKYVSREQNRYIMRIQIIVIMIFMSPPSLGETGRKQKGQRGPCPRTQAQVETMNIRIKTCHSQV